MRRKKSFKELEDIQNKLKEYNNLVDELNSALSKKVDENKIKEIAKLKIKCDLESQKLEKRINDLLGEKEDAD